MSPLLELANVACRRGGRMLFRGVTLSIGAGEAVVATGPNGVGKSSLIRIAAGLLPQSGGTVRRGAATALLGPEDGALDRELPLYDALGFWARIDGTDDQAVAAAIAAVDLDPLILVPIRLLSTGQRKRAALARVIAGDAPLWLLDEPANGLDGASVSILEREIARHRGAGGAVLIATHLPIAVPGATALSLERFR